MDIKNLPPLAYAPAERRLSGPCGYVALPPGPALLAERLLLAPGKMVPRDDLIAALALPDTVGAESDAVLRSHLKTVRVLAAALSGGAMLLLMRGQDAAGLMPTRGRCKKVI